MLNSYFFIYTDYENYFSKIWDGLSAWRKPCPKTGCPFNEYYH